MLLLLLMATRSFTLNLEMWRARNNFQEMATQSAERGSDARRLELVGRTAPLYL